MKFTYEAYADLIDLLRKTDYEIVTYDTFSNCGKCVIIRHDIDNSLNKAAEFARTEFELGVKSTYFLLLTSDLYNVFSLNGMKMIEKILTSGHEIGLHFDEVRYPEVKGNLDFIREMIGKEARLLESAVGVPITKVSMHRPSKNILDSDLEIPGITNTYSKRFFVDFKYVSDSRHIWREPVEDIIQSGLYERIQILMHPFWYSKVETDIKRTIKSFINAANLERYQVMADNISNLSEIMGMDEVCK